MNASAAYFNFEDPYMDNNDQWIRFENWNYCTYAEITQVLKSLLGKGFVDFEGWLFLYPSVL